MMTVPMPGSGAASVALPQDLDLVLRVVPMPADLNANGEIFGGWIMAQVDMAAGVMASRIARGRVATVAVNQFIFKQRVSVGDLLSLYGRLERIGTTSLTLHIEVWAERNPAALEVVKVTQANLTLVALDEHSRPRPVVQP